MRLLDSLQHLSIRNCPAYTWQLISRDCRDLAHNCSGMQTQLRGFIWSAAVPSVCLCLQTADLRVASCLSPVVVHMRVVCHLHISYPCLHCLPTVPLCLCQVFKSEKCGSPPAVPGAHMRSLPNMFPAAFNPGSKSPSSFCLPGESSDDQAKRVVTSIVAAITKMQTGAGQRGVCWPLCCTIGHRGGSPGLSAALLSCYLGLGHAY